VDIKTVFSFFQTLRRESVPAHGVVVSHVLALVVTISTGVFRRRGKDSNNVVDAMLLVFRKDKYGVEEKSKAVIYIHKVCEAIAKAGIFFCTSTMQACFLRIKQDITSLISGSYSDSQNCHNTGD